MCIRNKASLGKETSDLERVRLLTSNETDRGLAARRARTGSSSSQSRKDNSCRNFETVDPVTRTRRAT